MIHFFQTHFYFFILILILLGVCVGSFLNVVIYRLPKIILEQWETRKTADHPEKDFNLILPASHCPTCKEKIPNYLNIPVLGYFLSKRKCKFCQSKIPTTYPLVELISGIAPVLIAYKWGISLETLAATLFTWLLLPLILIDIKHQLLPDILTLTGLWLGLAFNLFNLFTPLEDAVIGVIAGYLSLWIVGKLFYLIQKKEGIGYGDFKLFAMLGAWQGWEDLPFILLQASLLGLLVSVIRVFLKKQKVDAPVPFGPYLAMSGWVTLFFGESIAKFYQYTFTALLG